MCVVGAVSLHIGVHFPHMWAMSFQFSNLRGIPEVLSGFGGGGANPNDSLPGPQQRETTGMILRAEVTENGRIGRISAHLPFTPVSR